MPESNAERYKHSPLQGHSSIRMLTLWPGDFGTPLRGQISELQQPLNVPYEALSYTWGDFASTETIQICESADFEHIHQVVPITRNLYGALQRLRTDVPRRLWIDAICIDQDNLEEKGHQVARMDQLYREAGSVIVWLGEDQSYPRTRALLMQDSKNRWPLTLPEVDLGELVTIPWFSRVWAVQEYVLPQHASYQLGPLSVSANHLETVVKRIGTYMDGDKRLHDQWKSICLLFEYRELVQKRGWNEADPRLTLVRTFLDLTRQRLCKDSRDRIYSVLGIYGDVEFVPDYTLPPQRVYKDFVSKTLEAGDFSILHECCIGITNADEQSYVPFFGQSRSQTKYIPFADPLGATYSAGLHQQPRVNVDQGKYISIQGFHIDTVQQKLDLSEDCDINLDSAGLVINSPSPNSELEELPLHGTWGAIYQTIMNHLITDTDEALRWRKDYEENRLSPQFAKAPYPHNSLFEVLVRAIRTDLNADYDWVSTKGQIRTDAHLHRSRRKILAERSLFWTDKGYIGLGTCHLQAGDEVVVFSGDTTPFLLRKEAHNNGPDVVYSIVSDCYACGWMYGPFPDKTVARDPSLRRSITKKLKGHKMESRPALESRTFVIG
ncbi:uncharacterized protein EKO05_0002770 [Ascochyta rabiei]|uniref:uncharacterized protein n=1 Tax=Didymella rabiei TaxID=5454 RepID=UPI001900CF2B|nr:uncharacterized protein EKO05_0002770 [Ascochyta rabiei]UPX12207.1 hypothetical protein EKO05_0002770 [Ascochyta rabiei]